MQPSGLAINFEKMKTNLFNILREQLENHSPARLNVELSRETIFIDWRIHLECNLNCGYCFFDGNLRETTSMDESVVNKVVELVNTSDRQFILNICGGEPFLNKANVRTYIELTRKSDLIIGTNLTSNNVFEFADTVNIERVPFMLASYHYKFLSYLQKIDFFKRFLYLQDKGFNIVFGIIYHPADDMEMVEKILDDAKQKGLRFVTVKTFIGEYNGKIFPKSYSRKHIKFIKKHATLDQEICIAKFKFSMYRKYCIAGFNYFHLSPDGIINNCDVLRNYITNVKDLSSFEELTNDGRVTFCKEKICYCLGPLLRTSK